MGKLNNSYPESGIWGGMMEVCLKCLRFVPRVSIGTPYDFRRRVDRIKSFVNRGVLNIVQSSSPLEEIPRDGPLQDNYFYAFQCARCGREFQLLVDIYHGRGSWK
jgi:hypothetical protein